MLSWHREKACIHTMGPEVVAHVTSRSIVLICDPGIAESLGGLVCEPWSGFLFYSGI